MQSSLHVTEPGVGGPHGQSVTKAAMAEREEDIGSATIPFPYMEELTAQENDTKRRAATQRVVLVRAKCLVYFPLEPQNNLKLCAL